MTESNDVLRALDESEVRDLLPGPARVPIKQGDVFHNWTVVAESGTRNGQRAYQCRCQCGNNRVVVASKLRSGWSKSCGCLKAAQASQRYRKPVITGETFGRLTAVEGSYRRKTAKSSQEYVRCRCVCGVVKDYCVGHLRSKKIQSCGCLVKEVARSRGVEIFIGDVFGRYTVIRLDTAQTAGKKTRRRFVCRCECGAIRSVLAFSLANGAVKSCGCLKKLKAGTLGLTEDEKKSRQRESRKTYRRENADRVRQMGREYRRRNKAAITARKLTYEQQRRTADPSYKVLVTLRKRVSKTLRKKGSSASAIRDLGCDIEDFRRYIEKQFRSNWNWENYGTVWHVDHIYPLSSIDFTDPVETKAACNWRNLRPLAADENTSKNDTLSAKAQYLFNRIKEVVRRQLLQEEADTNLS